MKIKHLTISLLIMLPALAALMGLGSCTDDYLYNSVKGALEPGIPVEISLGLQVPEAEEAVVGSRASTDTETDRTVYDLYLFIFDDNTKQLKTKYYFPHINSTTGGIACDPAYSTTGSAAILRKGDGSSKTSGTIEKIHTSTGPSRIVGVANCNRKGSALILEKLNKIKTIDELKDIMVSTYTEFEGTKLSDFEQPLTVMSGYYCDKNTEHNDQHLTTPCDFFSEDPNNKEKSHTGYVDIDKEKLDGTLWLTPLQSRVKFIVLSEGQKDPANVIPAGKFELTSWQVYNLPGKTPLFCHGYSDEQEPLEPNPIKTLAITRFDSEEEVVKDELPAAETYDGIFGFNFFAADNHPGKGNAENIKTYGDRARWTGDDYSNPTSPDKKHYTNAPAGATYVVLRGTYTGASYITEDGSDTPVLKNVTGDVTYTIFLGHDSGSGEGADNTDFNTYRNYNYTYIVRVKGVNKISVEVNKDIEDRPDAEGDIITTSSSNITIDAHYEQRVVAIKKQDVINAIAADNFQVTVTVPLFNVNRLAYKYKKDEAKDEDRWADTNNALPYMEWLEFYEHKENELGRRYIHYSDVHGDASRGIDRQIMNVKEFMQRLYEYANDENAPEELTFTVYFSEYLYKTKPGTDEKVQWQDLLRDGRSRRFTMLGTSKYSTDHNSSYTTSGTTFVQRCMQTIYDVDMAGLQQGWATECVEEDIFEAGNTGVPYDMYSAKPVYQWNRKNLEVSKFGRQNCWRVNSGKNGSVGRDTWEYKLLINDDGYLKPPTNKGAQCRKNETNLLTACLQRNRDKNGNGFIDRNEFVWYIPSLEQMQLLYIGYGALTEDVQLYNVQRETRAGRVSSTEYENRHYLTSSLNKLWAEEGVSFSDLNLNTTGGWNGDDKFYVRCARSLGTSEEDTFVDYIPWDIDKHPEFQFESIFNYQPYARKIEDTEEGEIITYPGHKLGLITMRYLNPQSLINVPRLTETPGVVHSFSDNNYPAFQYEVADTVIAINDTYGSLSVDPNKLKALFKDLKDVPDFSPCNLLGPGWRIPTITELVVMQWAWNENWSNNLWQDFKTKLQDISEQTKNDGYYLTRNDGSKQLLYGYKYSGFVNNTGNCDLLSRTEYYYSYPYPGLYPTFNKRVRAYHVFEKNNPSTEKFSIELKESTTHSGNMAIRCVRSYTTAQANAPAQSPAATRAAVKRGVRKK